MKLDRRSFEQRDAEDPLAPVRDLFVVPDGIIYLDGNSLGALPRETPERVRALIEEEWGQSLIRSWNTHGWIHFPRRIGDKIASLIGARAGEVVASDSTSVNLFKLLAASVGLRPDRRVIVSEKENFPTDLYIAQGVTEMLGNLELRLVERGDLLSAIDEDVAVVSLTHVDFRTGEIHDMAAVTAHARKNGALALWDLSHSAGALPVDLERAGADFAVGCGYKYLNWGPGAPAYLFAASRHHEAMRPPLAGWMGHADPFAFDTDYRPAPGIERNLCGTPSVIAMAALEVGLDIVLDADIARVREKSQRLGDVFVELVDDRADALGLSIACPRDSAARGSQVSLRHPEGYAIMRALAARGVIGDFRAPDVLRFGLTPLYLRYVDVWDAVAALVEVIETDAHHKPEFQARQLVT